MLLLLSVACRSVPPVDTGTKTADTGDEWQPPVGDTSDSDDSAPDSAPLTCEDTFPDVEVPIDTTCITPPRSDWSLHERWRYDDADVSDVTVHTGRFQDTNGDGAIDAADEMGIFVNYASLYSTSGPVALLDARGGVVTLDSSYNDAMRDYASTADFDTTRAGTEIGVSTWVRDLGYSWAAGDAAGRYLTEPVLEQISGIPWYVDLDADGAPEALLGGIVIDPTTGYFLWQRDSSTIAVAPVAADIDRDGVPEVIGPVDGGGVGIWRGGDGAPIVCPATPSGAAAPMPTYAIANLDGDDDAELLQSDAGVISLCDTDGSLLVERTVPSDVGGIVGVAELDGDLDPEILVNYLAPTASPDESGIIAYDTALNELWRREVESPGWSTFTLADLDQDGRHEIIVRESGALTILDGSGTVLASVEDGAYTGQWNNVPLVVDLDGDGLAEIVTGAGSPTVQVWDNDSGGWAVPGAEVPSPGIGHHPGILNPDGSVPEETAWWLGGGNVWQGHAAFQPIAPDLGVRFESVCAESCDDDLYATVYVANTGTSAVSQAISVNIWTADGYAVTDTTLEPPLPAGSSRAVQVRVPTDLARAGLYATVDDAGTIAECDESDNRGDWTGTPCP